MPISGVKVKDFVHPSIHPETGHFNHPYCHFLGVKTSIICTNMIGFLSAK